MVLPSPANPELGFWGAFNSDGIQRVGGSRSRLGYTVPLTTGVWLDKIAAELCTNPSTFLQGTVGIRFGTDLPGGPAYMDGAFTLESSTGRLHATGKLSAFGLTLGNAFLTYTPEDSVEFGGSLNKDDLNWGVAWLDHANFSGWYKGGQAELYGTAQLCLVVLGCAGAEAVISTRGVGACAEIDVVDIGIFKVSVEAGAGSDWSGNFKLMLANCGLGSWRVPRTTRALRQAGTVTGYSFVVPPGEVGVGVNVVGVRGAPKVRLTGPDGRVIESSRTTSAAMVKGDAGFMLVESAADRATSLVIANPAAGTWKVEPLPDPPVAGDWDIARVETADHNPAPPIHASVPESANYSRVVDIQHMIDPRESRVRLVERAVAAPGDPVVIQDLGYVQRGSRAACPAGLPQGTRCLRRRFTPAYSPTAGKHQIVAMALDRRTGRVIEDVVLAEFDVPAAPLSDAPTVTVDRQGESVTVTWGPMFRAHQAEIVLSSSNDEQRIARFDADQRSSVTFTGISRDATGTVRVHGLNALGMVGAETARSFGRAPLLADDCPMDFDHEGNPTGTAVRQELLACERAID
jgi:hypothetical protein